MTFSITKNKKGHFITRLKVRCRYAECRYAESRYAECRYAECHGAVKGVLALAPWST